MLRNRLTLSEQLRVSRILLVASLRISRVLRSTLLSVEANYEESDGVRIIRWTMRYDLGLSGSSRTATRIPHPSRRSAVPPSKAGPVPPSASSDRSVDVPES